MAKRTRNTDKSKSLEMRPEKQAKEKSKATKSADAKEKGYLWGMSDAPALGTESHWMQCLPVVFWTAFIVMIVRMHIYQRDMSEFYWYGGSGDIYDFFSYFKMIAILVTTALVIVLLLYRVFTQTMAIKKSSVYIPMAVFSLMVILSYLFSDYKEFSLLGYNDRFEGTLVLVAYMVMLFYIINTVETEKNVKWVIYPLGVTSGILGLLGLSQGTGHDFFRTALGQKLISPNSMTSGGQTINQLIDAAAEKGEQLFGFTFQNNEIYQTVYNINYVSFYLTLLIPLFGLIFIRGFMKGKEEKLWATGLWLTLWALLLYNLIGSASSGGFLGMAAVVAIALVLFNKHILKWWKPIAILLVITVLVGGATFDRWSGELMHAVKGSIVGTTTDVEETTEAAHKLQYIDTEGDDIIIGIDENTLTITTYFDSPDKLKILDQNGENIGVTPTATDPVYAFDDERLQNCFIQPAQDEKGNNYYLFTCDHQERNWAFRLTENGVFYLNGLGNLVDLDKVEAVGFANNESFGSGRGYIWSRSIPMMADNLIIGTGADTYALEFPHKDYVGKANSSSYSNNINIIVDKPHNMYMNMVICTGMVSLIAFLTILALYAVQSIKVYRGRKYDSFMDFAGVGIFLGVMGFAVTGLVDDSTVSVMPMFTGLLGIGIAINMILEREKKENIVT